MEYKREKYLQKLIDLKDVDLIKVITGVRRCGKSYLLNNIFYKYLINSNVKSDHIVSVQFDKEENKEYRDMNVALNYLKSFIKDDEEYFFLLDEVQLIYDKEDPSNKSAFFDVLNSLHHIDNANIYVTGSNSQFLSKDILTTFRGRSFQIHMMPLTFSEYMEDTSLNFEEALNEYLIYGGLPMIKEYKTEELKKEYLNSIFSEIYNDDLKERYVIKNASEFDELINIASSQIGCPCSYKSLSNTFKSEKNILITSETIEKYLSYLESAFILNKAQKYDIKGKKYINAYQKYYFEDLGLRNVRLNFRQNEKTHLMENLIYNELISHGYSVDVGMIEKNERNNEGKQVKKQLEVDFVCNKNDKKYYIQSAYSIEDLDKYEQEEKSLLNINDNFKKIIIAYDALDTHRNQNGTLIIKLKDFLLDPDSLEK